MLKKYGNLYVVDRKIFMKTLYIKDYSENYFTAL